MLPRLYLLKSPTLLERVVDAFYEGFMVIYVCLLVVFFTITAPLWLPIVILGYLSKKVSGGGII